MFCSNCGKKISAGNICPECGAKSESLRSFKKLDINTDIYNNQITEQQKTPIIREKIIYKNDSRQRKSICVLSAFVILFILITIIALIYSHGTSNKLKELQSSELIPVSEDSYNISGAIERNSNDYAFVILNNALSFEINNEQYETHEIYLSPDTSIIDGNAEFEGRICKLSDDMFMIIPN